jgi:hypothetical protein
MQRPPLTETAAPVDDELPVVATIEQIGHYYRGTVHDLHRSPERGRVHSASGRDIPFVFQHVTLKGAGRHFDDLREGLVVGYDVSWTARGLRVCTIWIPD